MAKLSPKLLPAGEYYVGDPCYVLHEAWSEICDVICDREFNMRAWTLELDDGRLVTMANTAYGDGEYQDESGNRYGVDAGLLGAILVSDVVKRDDNHIPFGHVHTQEMPFSAKYHNGTVILGNVRIETLDVVDEYDPEDEDDNDGFYDQNY